ncbi:MAG: fumarylacetoacetase [Pseudomonadota bacterium]
MALKRSWVPGANDPGCEFPLNNLPYGVMRRGAETVCVTAVGDSVFDLRELEAAGLIEVRYEMAEAQAAGLKYDAFQGPVAHWNSFMMMADWAAFRAELTALFVEGGSDALRGDQALLERAMVPLAEAELALPFHVREFTDFYASKHHATNVGTMFRGPENALPPNWLHIPIGYNGRASSVVVSGTDVRRPWGQLRGESGPRFSPSERFDFELELGAIVGRSVESPATVAEADAAIFGYVLLNDWSARDIQAWEYQPLGPFQAKATATTISPWIVTAAALEPFRRPVPPREISVLSYLEEPHPTLYDIALEVDLERGGSTPLTRTNYAVMYWSSAQQFAHHTTSGCEMVPGDLLGSGTISGPEKTSRGSLLELSWGGKDPLPTHAGPRSFIEDGDTIVMRGAALGDCYRIGFGDCRGTLLAALDDPYARTMFSP